MLDKDTLGTMQEWIANGKNVLYISCDKCVTFGHEKYNLRYALFVTHSWHEKGQKNHIVFYIVLDDYIVQNLSNIKWLKPTSYIEEVSMQVIVVVFSHILQILITYQCLSYPKRTYKTCLVHTKHCIRTIKPMIWCKHVSNYLGA